MNTVEVISVVLEHVYGHASHCQCRLPGQMAALKRRLQQKYSPTHCNALVVDERRFAPIKHPNAVDRMFERSFSSNLLRLRCR